MCVTQTCYGTYLSRCHSPLAGEAWLSVGYPFPVGVRCAEATSRYGGLGVGSGGSARWHEGLKLEASSDGHTWKLIAIERNSNFVHVSHKHLGGG
jgi:hypothetical protein